MNSKIDLHIHTAASDGTDSVPVLWAHIREQRIQCFAVTDHDTVDGSREMATVMQAWREDRAAFLAQNAGEAAFSNEPSEEIRFIPGIEFSCKTEQFKCHILGYGFDAEHPEIQAVIAQGEMRRQENLEKRIQFLEREYGIVFPAEVLARLRSVKTVGKPHIGQEMVELGLANSVDEAIQTKINGCRAGEDRVDAARAIRAIREAGGVAVWAHPLGGEGKQHLTPERFRGRLDALLALGIQGLECHYSRYTPEEAAFLCGEAKRHGLCVSGGSDYHGANKTIALGELNTAGEAIAPSQLSVVEKWQEQRALAPLLNQGYCLEASEYSREHFGNRCMTLRRGQTTIRFISDRGEFVCLLGLVKNNYLLGDQAKNGDFWAYVRECAEWIAAQREVLF